MASDFQSFTRSLVTSSVKIARTGFSFALSFLPEPQTDSQTSPSTWESARAPVTVADPSGNGTSDPIDPELAYLDAAVEGDDQLDRDRLGGQLEELRFNRVSDKATLPTRGHDSDAGLDLYAAEAARIGPGERVSVGTGLAVQVPEGLAGLVLPRSGLALKHGIALVNSPGLIDPGYRGELRVLLLNTDRTSEVRIAVGDRIAQLLLVPIARASPLEADSLDSSARGPSGFGSTGA